MQGVYTATAKITTTGGDVLAITAASNISIEILRAELSSNDETNIMAECGLYRATSATGTAVTELQTEPGAATATATVVHTATPTGQASDALYRAFAPMTGGWIYAPTPEERIVVKGGACLILELTETITSASVIGTLVWREIG